MAKALKIIGTVAGFVALAATGLGAVGVAAVAGAKMATVAGIAALAAGVANAGTLLLTKPPPARGSVTQLIIAPDAAQPYVMGEGYFGGMLRYRRSYGATLDKVPNPYRFMAVVYSGGGPVQSISPRVEFQTIGSYYSGFLYTGVKLGYCPDTALTPQWSGAPGWTTSSKLSGKACIGWSLKFDKNGKVFASGVPALGAHIQGVKVYDPRLDSTFPGGAGSCRLGNEATYVYSQNPALHAGTYAFGRYQNGKRVLGIGLPAEAIDWANVAAWANVCDANGWTMFGVVFEPGDRFTNLRDICQAGGAEPLLGAAGLHFHYAAPRVALDTITIHDLIERDERSINAQATWRDRLNTIVPKGISEAHNWQQVPDTAVQVSTFLTEDGQLKQAEWPFNFVKNADQRAELAAYRLWDSREIQPIELVCSDRLRAYRPGDCLELDLQEELGWEGPAVILKKQFDPIQMAVRLTLMTETPGKHAYCLGQTGTPPPTPALGQTAQDRDDLIAAVNGATEPRGLYSNAEIYRERNVVSLPDGSEWLFISAAPASGQAPPSWPITGNAFWLNITPPLNAEGITYTDGTPIEDLQPAEPGATDGAVVPQPGSGVAGNIRDHLGQIYDPGELLNTSIELTPAGRLQYRGLPEDPPVSLGDLALPDLGAASVDAMRRAEDDVDALATALATALDEASQTRRTFTDAGFFVDPATGQVRIHAIEQTRERLSTAEVRLNAAEASISLRATVNYVDQAIASAVLDPSQVADLETIFVRLTAAEVDIDGLNATVTTLATATELSLVAGRVTTAEQAIDALEGQITTKVDTTTFNALETRVTSAESTLTAIGDVAQITNAVTATRLLAREVDANAEADLRALLQGDRAQRDQVAAIAAARQELRADVSDGLSAEAAARLALQVRIGQAEASLATESITRASETSALAAQITSLEASTDSSIGELTASITAEQQARTDEDSALALSITNLNASFSAAITAEQQARVTAITSEAETRAAAINAEADARIAAIAQEANDRGEALITEAQARIDAINEERAQTLADVAAEATARQAAVTSLTASIEQEAIARADADGAIAASLTSLTTQVGEHTATLTQYGESIDGLEARQGVRLDVNGRVTGYVQNNDGTQGNFIIVADNFEVVDPDTGVAFLDADEDGLKLRNGRVIMDNGTFLKAIGTGFGTSGQFIEWFGPRPAGGNLALCEEATAISYLKANGDAYFGGALTAGTISNSGRTTLASATQFTLGTFISNGGALTVVVNDVASRVLASDSQTWRPGIDPAPADPFAASRVTYRATYLVESSTDGGANWTNRGNYTQDTISVSRVIGAGFTPPPDAEPLRRWQHVIEPSLTRTLTITLGVGSEHMIRFTRTSIIDLASGLSVAGQVATTTIGITSTEQ